jgi:hypothetical protein
MTVHKINNLKKKDIPLYYRNEYEGLGEIEISAGEFLTIPLEFTVEIKPTGERVVSVKVKQRIDYPLLPLIKAIKEKVIIMEKNGELR